MVKETLNPPFFFLSKFLQGHPLTFSMLFVEREGDFNPKATKESFSRSVNESHLQLIQVIIYFPTSKKK